MTQKKPHGKPPRKPQIADDKIEYVRDALANSFKTLKQIADAAGCHPMSIQWFGTQNGITRPDGFVEHQRRALDPIRDDLRNTHKGIGKIAADHNTTRHQVTMILLEADVSRPPDFKHPANSAAVRGNFNKAGIDTKLERKIMAGVSFEEIPVTRQRTVSAR